MKMFTGIVLVSMFALFAAPAFAGTPVQLWHCELDDDATEEAVIDAVESWLAAARKVDGGEGMTARILFPVAVNAVGEFDMWIIISTPSFAEWGRFWDGYPDSDAGDVEEDNSELFICPGSALWESIIIE